jgi:6-phosphofructokinase 1
MRIGVLTGGGDCAGLNATIRAIVRTGLARGDEIIGFHHGWRGVVDADSMPLSYAQTRGLLHIGGTILRTAGFHPEEHENGVPAVLATVAHQRLDVLIVIGGDGTLGSARHLANLGVPIIGVAKTIDNDVSGTNRCIGFDTAVAIAVEAISRVETTGESHDRLMVVEVMGRAVGWLAVCAGIAAGADALCLPEIPTNFDDLAAAITRRHDVGSTSSVVVVAEGALDGVFLGQPEGAVGAHVRAELAKRTGYDSRLTVLGHIQRGGAPVASDRLLATCCGVAAVAAAHAGALSTLVSVIDNSTTLVPIDVVAGARPVPNALLEVARSLSAC